MVLWSDVYPLGSVVTGKEAYQEVRQQLCVNDTQATLTLQKRIYHEYTDAAGTLVEEELSPWRAVPEGALLIPRDPAYTFEPERKSFERRDATPPALEPH